MKRIVVVGAGFAGLWSALAAARKLDELQQPADQAEVVVLNPQPYHSVRVRNYEQPLDPTLVPLDGVFGPTGVRFVQATAHTVDSANRRVMFTREDGEGSLEYDRLILAVGSELVRPEIPGLDRHSFDVDTYAGACKLQAHLSTLPALPDSPGRYTAVVIGAGLTGIELAAELPGRLREIVGEADRDKVRVVLADRSPKIAQSMGGAQSVVVQAMTSLDVELRPGVSLEELDGHGASLSDGVNADYIQACTVVWCGGMRANALASQLPVGLDSMGRVPVDAYLRVTGVPGVFAAGDCARVLIDGKRPSVMSCQHGRPMGRYAGNNAVCDLYGEEMLPLQIDWYTTVCDLGPWGAVYTEGWERKLVSEGEAAKATKRTINGERIYPPRSGCREELFRAAAPIVQTPPPTTRADS
ncbi:MULTISPECIES: FAD-dependent oxidoreductase [unclassified Caballeronia]|uniref:NAD(P)/FAD-dependent oxidoreductase n=1 Tax=unclassified Caballeronia TaxID=2646786 RepID=UPI00286049EB|nr:MULTISPECIES: FAD-dependent oxidoreductase [unclassified Caballeronia]MDR5774764.1 FAD-dependent oxidoreductase [Caballeronia sp. LZ002]MDR5850200.1 FAD-dependent oxidoreductase [Caballeronia sp. LZ003]